MPIETEHCSGKFEAFGGLTVAEAATLSERACAVSVLPSKKEITVSKDTDPDRMLVRYTSTLEVEGRASTIASTNDCFRSGVKESRVRSGSA